MTDFSQVINWLNQVDRSYISPALMPVLQVAQDLTASDSDRRDAYNTLVNATASSRNRWEQVEARVLCAGFEHEQRNVAVAYADLTYAVETYQALRDIHRHAISSWLLGFVEWDLSQNISAAAHWRATNEELLRLERLYEERGYPDIAAWYAARARDISVDLACTPEEGYAWYRQLQRGENNPRREALNSISTQLETAIVAGDDNKAVQLKSRLEQLSKSQRKNQEKAEIDLECGFWKYQSGEEADAYRYLKRAIQGSRPDILLEALARWIMGAMQWRAGNLTDQAIKNWTICIELFDQLISRANWEKQLNYLPWYRNIRDLMERAKAQKVGG